MFNLEGLIPKLCQLAREIGDDDKALRLRSAGMQVLAVLVRFPFPHYCLQFFVCLLTCMTAMAYMTMRYL